MSGTSEDFHASEAAGTEAGAAAGPPAAPVAAAPHRPADDSEEVYYDGSPLARGGFLHLCAHFVLGAVLVLLPFVIGFWRHYWWPWWLVLGLPVLGVLLALAPLAVVKMVRYRITNYRIDYERGLLAKTIDTLELWHVEDLHFYQSLFDRMLGVGTITVLSKDESLPRLVMKGLPNSRPLFETLKQRVIAVKRQRGVIKMDVG